MKTINCKAAKIPLLGGGARSAGVVKRENRNGNTNGKLFGDAIEAG